MYLGWLMNQTQAKWPKRLRSLSPEQIAIKDDFMKHWHEVLPKKYGVIERFNHGYPAKHGRVKGQVLEIGAGIGEHIRYEDLSGISYHAVELRPDMARTIAEQFPGVKVQVGDCQERLNYSDSFFDKVIAIHVLEHLPNLPAAIREVHRVLKPGGIFSVVIPCEGGLAYSLAREISAKRIFKKRYKMSYDWFIETEHINLPGEILAELKPYFSIRSRSYFPLHIPISDLNLVIGLTLTRL
jgi:SAM-dependent methyltransferase